jgi:hypothetical protein
MIQHLAACGMLNVEKVIHKIQWTGYWVCTPGKLQQFIFGVYFFAVRRFDQYRF